MARYIDVGKLLKELTHLPDGRRIPDVDCDNFPVKIDLRSLKRIILRQPTADVAEVKHAEWIGDMGNLEYDDYCCSCCGRYTETRNKTRLPVYCGFCGAKMNGRSDT